MSSELFGALKAPFAPSDIEWRVGQAGKKRDGTYWAKVLAYVTNRAIMDRLDSVVGPENWKNEFQFVEGGALCGLSVRIDGEWITKWDGSDPTDVEAFKGLLSGAMKRAAVQFGVGRYLYDLGESWANINDSGAHYGTVKVDGKSESFKWDHPKLPAWALPAGTPEHKAATVESQTGGKAARVSPNQERVQQLTKLISEATDDDALNNIAQLCKADLDAKKITNSNFDYLLSVGRQKRESLKAMDAMDKRFAEVPS